MAAAALRESPSCRSKVTTQLPAITLSPNDAVCKAASGHSDRVCNAVAREPVAPGFGRSSATGANTSSEQAAAATSADS